jgi:hypothetical protein
VGEAKQELTFGQQPIPEPVRLARRLMTMLGAVNVCIAGGWMVLVLGFFGKSLTPEQLFSAGVQLGISAVIWCAVVVAGQRLQPTGSRVQMALVASGAALLLVVVQVVLSGFQVVGILNLLLTVGIVALLLRGRQDLNRGTSSTPEAITS